MDKSRELCDNGSDLEKFSVTIYAHSRADTPIEKWQPLQDHCKAVAGMSAAFATPFASGAHGRILGYLHDLGKAHTSSQLHQKQSQRRVIRGS